MLWVGLSLLELLLESCEVYTVGVISRTILSMLTSVTW